jgi:hypothetical protein
MVKGGRIIGECESLLEAYKDAVDMLNMEIEQDID